MWHHLVLPWLHHCWCVEWEEDCSQTTIPEESCQHSQNMFMSINRTNFNEVNSSQNCVSKRVRLWEILAARWISSWLHLAFLLPQTWKIWQCNCSHTVLWTSCILCPKNSHTRAEFWQMSMWRNEALLEKSVHKQAKPLSPYSCASNIHAALYSFSQFLQPIKGGMN